LAQTIEEILQENSGIRLDIGCGGNKQPGFVGIDIRALAGVDIVHDLEEYPWPLPNDCVLVAIASHVLEHINPHKGNFIQFMDEAWRVLKPGAQWAISVPHGSSQGFIQDPTHINPINEVTWAYFDPLEPNTQGGLYRIYKPKPWKITHLTWSPAANIEVILEKRIDDPSYH